MKMYFHGGFEEVILFDFWRTTTEEGLIFSCIAVFIMGALYEGLKLLREVIANKSVPGCEGVANKDGTLQFQACKRPSVQFTAASILNQSHLLLTVLHVVQFFVAYLLMLIFMTYNSYLCLSLVLGTGVGYFLFGWKRISSLNEADHCH